MKTAFGAVNSIISPEISFGPQIRHHFGKNIGIRPPLFRRNFLELTITSPYLPAPGASKLWKHKMPEVTRADSEKLGMKTRELQALVFQTLDIIGADNLERASKGNELLGARSHTALSYLGALMDRENAGEIMTFASYSQIYGSKELKKAGELLTLLDYLAAFHAPPALHPIDVRMGILNLRMSLRIYDGITHSIELTGRYANKDGYPAELYIYLVRAAVYLAKCINAREH